MKNRHQPARHAFTLVEVMAATAIAGLMMAVIMGLLAQLGGQIRSAKEKHPYHPWVEVLRNQLEFDFAHCRSVIVTENEIRIDGYSSCDSAGGNVKRLPTYVVYRLSGQPGSPSWLVRREERLTGNINDARMATPVCFGVTGFQDMSDLGVDVPPGRWHLRLFLDPQAGLPGEMDIVLHRHGGPAL